MNQEQFMSIITDLGLKKYSETNFYSRESISSLNDSISSRNDLGTRENLNLSNLNKNFNDLDLILEEICPNISHLKYNKLLKECCKSEEIGDGGYYVETLYYQQSIKLIDLYNFLVKEKLI